MGVAFYINDTDDNINFIATPGDGQFEVPYYTPQAPPPGFPPITVGPPFSPVPCPFGRSWWPASRSGGSCCRAT